MPKKTAAAVLLAAALTACGSTDETTEPAPADERPSTTSEATTTTAATTTTLPERDQIDRALKVEVTGHLPDGDGSVDIYWTLTNTSPKTITAHQLYLDVTVADALGRETNAVFQHDCTRRPIAPGERVEVVVPARWSAAEQVARYQQRTPGQDPYYDAFLAAMDNCVVGNWDFNPYISDEAAMGSALAGGAQPRIVPVVSRVVFDDGTALGEAGG